MKLHLISFDVPYPADYGGVIDIYYKIKALHEEGVKITLHTFEYGRPKAKELEQLCEKVFYYKRKHSFVAIFNQLPYIVVTRQSKELFQNLLADNSPILFEGLHSCYYLSHEKLKDRTKLVRTHNIEHSYYSGLATAEKNIFKKLYFNSEARKLEKFEKQLSHANHILAISGQDAKELSAHYKNVTNVMAFHPNNSVHTEEGKGEFALYHGNLAVSENDKAALYLVNTIFNDISIPFIIAGNKPSKELQEAVKKYSHIQLKSNIPTNEIDTLVKSAQVNVLPTFQPTGLKLKLLNALFNGKHCVVNTAMVANTGLEILCSISDTDAGMKNAVKKLFKIPFDKAEIEKRKQILEDRFSNKVNAKKITRLL